MPEAQNLRDVFVHELRDIYNAEQQITKALPKLIKAAESEDLRDAFETHLDETHAQIDRLEEAFALLDEKVRGVSCEGMTGILAEGKHALGDGLSGSVRDAALIGAAQRVEHYETAAYGTLIAWARTMGRNDVADLLQTNLEEEKHADEKLSELAQSGINQAAAGTDTASPKGNGRGRVMSMRNHRIHAVGRR